MKKDLELKLLRDVAVAAREVWQVCNAAPTFEEVNPVLIERRLDDLEEALLALGPLEDKGDAT